MTPPDDRRCNDGRRLEDAHCDMHHENTLTLSQNSLDIAGIKAYSKAMTIILPAIFTIASAVVGYYVSQMDKTMDKLADNLAIVNQTVQQNQLTMAVNNQKLADIEARLAAKK